MLAELHQDKPVADDLISAGGQGLVFFLRHNVVSSSNKWRITRKQCHKPITLHLPLKFIRLPLRLHEYQRFVLTLRHYVL